MPDQSAALGAAGPPAVPFIPQNVIFNFDKWGPPDLWVPLLYKSREAKVQYRRGEKNKTNKPAGVSVLLCDIFTTDGSACQYHRVGACNYPATRSIKPLTLTSPLDKLINCYLSQTSKGLCYCQRVRSVRSFQGLIHVIFFFLCSFFFLFSCFFFFLHGCC